MKPSPSRAPRRPRRPAFLLLASALLLVGLATVQYRWIGQLGAAEERSRRENLDDRLRLLCQDFDQEIGDMQRLLQFTFGEQGDRELLDAAGRLLDWQERALFPGLLADVFWIESDRGSHRWQRFELATATLAPLDDPELMARWQPLLEGVPPASSPAPRQPALLVSSTRQSRAAGRPLLPLGAARRHVLVPLDPALLAREVFPSLVDTYFGRPAVREFDLEVMPRNSDRPLYSTTDQPLALVDGQRDFGHFHHGRLVVFTHFDTRDGDLQVFRSRATTRLATETPAITVPDEVGPTVAVDLGVTDLLGRAASWSEGAAWTVRATHREGSLAAVSARLRRRNLLLCFGVLLVLAITLVVLDRTARRARLLAEQRMAFVAGASHELRTPLAVITSAAENLADGVVQRPEVAHQYGQLIHERSRHLTGLVENILSLAGIPGRGMQAAGRRFAPLAAAEQAIENCRGLAQRHQASVRLDAEEELPEIPGDAATVTAAIDNLIQNAIKYGGPAPVVEVRLRATRSPERRGVRVEVADRGPGIDPTLQQRVFEPFFRAPDAARQPGSGLGLALVQEIATARGGRVELDSKPGAGTCIALFLPAAEAAP